MKRLLASASLSVCAALACTIEVADFTGKKCESASDCPEPYVCVAARPGEGRTCEVLGLPGTRDVNAGPVPTWCADIEPILAASCVSSCHGADTSGSGNSTFRLDYYAPDAGGVPGARAKAERIRQRASVFQDMPPPEGSVPIPTAEQRALIARWAEGGAPLCVDGGVDAGLPDGGADGGS
ncbi:hypothetical protein [Myxococcus sp. RHSTA-1-4]|uniref:hypothetical protein n=1 Tax=Myxococcus sp. RHSTA-1-4 TaxID=2874601 RepID=UPI001CBD4F72|nr:hypothetical protein [Myxococcus sp. RHSTA-1-4]MBZ4416368.1 hypothetical protein [Myxococcus sp. RHSTA-1-4]